MVALTVSLGIHRVGKLKQNAMNTIAPKGMPLRWF
jgi:hypothetical protein